MRNPLRALGPRWRVQRARHPQATARVEDAAAGLRGIGRLVAEVRTLRTRVVELERDHLLLAAHVATLTERAGGGPASGAAGDDEAARQRARLAAVAWYEERIARLEDAVDRRGHARTRRDRATAGRTFDEHGEGRP